MISDGATVLVTDAGRGSAICIIQSLARQGYRVVAADDDPRSPGLRSRLTCGRVVYPDPIRDVRGFVDRLREAIVRHRVSLVIPVTDPVLRVLAEVRGELDELTRLPMPEAEALDIANDKARTLELAQRLDVPVPRTHVVHTVEDALELAPELGWPVVLKPQASTKLGASLDARGIEAFEVDYADSPSALAARMERLEGRSPVLLQRYTEGEGVGVELLLSKGRPLAAFQHRRLRETPPSGGASALRESVDLDPRLYDWSLRLLAALDWSGLAMVEWKVGRRAELMEINGRVWGSLPLAVRSGVDFPGHTARLFLSGEEGFVGEPLGDYEIGVRSRDLGRDLLWIGTVLMQHRRHPCLPLPPRRRALHALLQLMDPRISTDAFAWDDPIPAFETLRRLIPRLLTKLIG